MDGDHGANRFPGDNYEWWIIGQRNGCYEIQSSKVQSDMLGVWWFGQNEFVTFGALLLVR